MSYIEPTDEAIAELSARPSDGPVVMINFLRYRAEAEYPVDKHDAPCSGRDAYGRYGLGVGPLLAKAGARVVWSGSSPQGVIAPESECWDDVILVEYPSPKHFLDMVTSADYQAVSYHRTAALADSRLIATSPGAVPES